jgi:hypothetical protein
MSSEDQSAPLKGRAARVVVAKRMSEVRRMVGGCRQDGLHSVSCQDWDVMLYIFLRF